MSLQSNFEIRMSLDYQAALDLGNAKAPLDYQKLIQIATGTGADQADLAFHDQRTIAGGGNEELDLAGVLTDAFGNTLTFARIKAIIINIISATGGPILVGGAATNALDTLFSAVADEIIVRKLLAVVAPDATAYVVTAGTADLLRLENADGVNAVTFDIVIIGASA